MDRSVYSLHAELEDHHWWFKARRRILFPLIDDVMHEQSKTLVIDVGCGTGGTVAALTGRYKCLGVDASRLAIDSALSRYPNASFEYGDVTGIADSVLSEAGLFLLMDVLEHIQDDHVFLGNLVKKMRPGSSLLITVPAKKSLWSQHDVTAQHVRRYEEDELLALFADQPLELRAITYFNSRLYPLIWLARAVGRMSGRTAGSDGTDLAVPPKLLNSFLEYIFAGERNSVRAAVKKGSTVIQGRGVSLLALLQVRS
jgi:2-polyprenyl-3-methyl-5-hydroxy-6-metoxy-1,4-benzoquinol methylase